jgi:hypothetical protein
MIGNDQVRFCEHCHLHVNNLSTMTRSEALRFVARSRGRICIRFVQGPSGPLTGKMPDKLYNIGRRASRLAAGAFSAALSISTAAAQAARRVPKPLHPPRRKRSKARSAIRPSTNSRAWSSARSRTWKKFRSRKSPSC